jgi:hypothetical protein
MCDNGLGWGGVELSNVEPHLMHFSNNKLTSFAVPCHIYYLATLYYASLFLFSLLKYSILR